MYNWQLLNWIFDNLPLGIINSYYPKFSDNLLGTQCFDIDNLSDPKKIFKKSLPSVYCIGIEFCKNN